MCIYSTVRQHTAIAVINSSDSNCNRRHKDGTSYFRTVTPVYSPRVPSNWNVHEYIRVSWTTARRYIAILKSTYVASFERFRLFTSARSREPRRPLTFSSSSYFFHNPTLVTYTSAWQASVHLPPRNVNEEIMEQSVGSFLRKPLNAWTFR